MVMLVVSGTVLCSPTTKLLHHKAELSKDDLSNDDILLPALLSAGRTGRDKRAIVDTNASTGNIQELLQTLGKT